MNNAVVAFDRLCNAATINLQEAQDQVARYAACVFEPLDWAEVRFIHRDKGKDGPKPCSECVPAGKLTLMVRKLADANAEGFNIYVGPNPRLACGAKGDAGVALARCLFVDFDKCAVDDAFERIVEAGLPTPTLTINSGHGCHAYWRMAEPMRDLASWKEIQKDLIALLGTDKVIFNPERMMRLPGFLNVKGEPVAVHIVEANRGL